ncbi:MAG: AGE family epimerase/isomerase [Candidatus Neomarinimicrobiota bacterium]
MKIETITRFRDRISRNLYENIIPFWMTHAVDHQNGGFYGRITNDLHIDANAPRGLILTGRILWTFSALYRFSPREEYLKMAQRAYHYLIDKFIDREYGGAYWMIDPQGKAVEDRKKIYGQAFVIYALSEYYTICSDKFVLEEAFNIFHLIEKFCHDSINIGYFEAANRDWSLSDNMQLSIVDMNEKKSMNSHLHLLEAFANLLRISNDGLVRNRLREIIKCHLEFIFNPAIDHLSLFFDEFWNRKSDVISFGHDVEASWLLCEAGEVIGEQEILLKVQQTALKLVAAVVAEGFTAQNALYTEKVETGQLHSASFDWWPQAEAVVGLLNAYEIGGDEKYFKKALGVWDFIEKYFVDYQYGEWFYEVSESGIPNPNRFKVSEWKCPYHNVRTCLEVLKRTEKII